MTKLTLSAEKEVIERAKRIARENKTSVSAMFSRFLLALSRRGNSENRIGPITRRATALIRLSNSANDERLLEDALSEKHGLR